MIYCAWILWNEEHLISKSIRSVKDYVDYFIFIDGAWKSNLRAQADGSFVSTDNTHDIVKSELPSSKMLWVSPTKYWLNEASKRTAYCKIFEEMGKKGDWLLWLDADEICIDNVSHGIHHLKTKAPYEPHWVWVKTTFPFEGPAVHTYDKWPGYRSDYELTKSTYFDMGRRLNIIPYLKNIHYVSPLHPFSGEESLLPIKAMTMKFFMIWNLVWLKNAKHLLWRLERSLIDRNPRSGRWRDLEWASGVLDEMEEKYGVKIDK